MQTHYYAPELPFGLNTCARWAVKPADTVCIFVHGFRGYALETWYEFPTILVEQGQCAAADLIFYGYDGKRARANTSANSFYDFLKKVGSQPAKIVNPTLQEAATPRRQTFKYRRIVLVSHSLGAVVTRFALLWAHQERKVWRKRVRQVLFAPAHKGSDISAMCSSILGMIKPLSAGGVDALLKLAYPVLKDLYVGSPTLKDLEDRTLRALSRKAKEHYLIAHRVIVGTDDNVVEPLQFGKDPLPVEFDGKGHIKVCKPNAGFLDPVTKLLEVL
jgi:alpha-beta hydrolase superfamily lysophospholipase